MKLSLLIILLVLTVFQSDGKKFSRCKLAKELIRTNALRKSFIGSWVCLIEHLNKNRATDLLGEHHKKKLYGLYQIPQEWCKSWRRGGGCHMRCEALLDDDIRDDSKCAHHIAETMGLKYWPVYTTRCNSNYLWYAEEIYKCADLRMPTKKIIYEHLNFNRQHSSYMSPMCGPKFEFN